MDSLRRFMYDIYFNLLGGIPAVLSVLYDSINIETFGLKFMDMKIRRKKEDMFDLIRQREESNEDRISFCKTHRLSLATFSYWRTKYRKSLRATSQGFVELKPASCSMLEIIYPNGVIIRLPPSSPLSDVQALVRLS